MCTPRFLLGGGYTYFMLKISADIGWVSVSIQTDGAYPDIADDLTNRAKNLLQEAVTQCWEAGWDPMTDSASEAASIEEED